MGKPGITVIEFLVCHHKLEINHRKGETLPRTIHQRQAVTCKECSKEAQKVSDGRVKTIRRFWRFA